MDRRKQIIVDADAGVGDNYHLVPRHRTMSDVLRQQIRTGTESVYAIAMSTGLEPASLRRFAAGKRSLRLDMADKLAAHFGFELTKRKN